MLLGTLNLSDACIGIALDCNVVLLEEKCPHEKVGKLQNEDISSILMMYLLKYQEMESLGCVICNKKDSVKRRLNYMIYVVSYC